MSWRIHHCSSSLQNLESCFFLIALHRFPHALVSCASAIESGLKAALNKLEHDRDGLDKLINEARRRSPGFWPSEDQALDDFRKVRNRVIHHGFSPKDDDLAASLLLRVGFRFLDRCYREFLGFSLEEGLLPDFFQQLTVAMEVHDKGRHIPNMHYTSCFSAFGHLIRWSFKDSLMANWEREAAQWADEGCVRFEVCAKRKIELERTLSPSWLFDCPICCEFETFVCELDESQLEVGQIGLLRAACADCGLVVRTGCPFLADLLCREQLDEKRPAILRDFGISSEPQPDRE